jgi:glycogen(starch) synthase
MARRARRALVCRHHMRGDVADVFGLAEERVTVVPNGVDPLGVRRARDLAALRARDAAPGERLVLLTGRLVYERGFQLALDALPGVIRRVGRDGGRLPVRRGRHGRPARGRAERRRRPALPRAIRARWPG